MKLWVKDILREMALMLAFALIVTLVILAFHSVAKAQSSVTVLTRQTQSVKQLDNVAINATRCITEETAQNNAVQYDVEYTRNAANSIYLTCYVGRTVAAVDKEVMVAVSTSLTGETVIAPSVWKRAVTASAKWAVTVANLPGPIVKCCFYADGAATVNDKITVWSRKVTP